MWNHWVFRACYPYQPFKNFAAARNAWTLLPKLFPDALAATLMSNHLHLILPRSPHDEKTRCKLAGFMGSISKQRQIHALWQPLIPPAPISDRLHLKRQLRYVALNPCRALLTHDPLEWTWSTYRDGVGAAADPWVRISRVAHALNERERGFNIRFHAYVSGDPTVAVAGTSFPKSTTPKIFSEESIMTILAAAAAALRVPASDVRKQSSDLRPLFIHLAWQQGWNQAKLLSKICDLSTRSIHLILEKPEPSGTEAALLCLGDRRLRKDTDFNLQI